MKFGLLSAILSDKSFEEVIDIAADAGFDCVELACWPNSKAERRYSGVCHLDADALDDEKSAYIKRYCAERNVEISALAFYPNTLDADLAKRNANVTHLKKLILLAEKLNISLVNTFIGRMQDRTIEENLEVFREVWPPIVAYAEEHHVKIAIENCPMLFDGTQWPGGQNLAYSPRIWDKMFEIIPSPSFGLNFDPSHFVWQMMDYIKPIYTYRDRILHVHFKDIHVRRDLLDEEGVLGYPLNFMTPKLPGLGDVNWKAFISALNDIGYTGYAVLEMEDRSFESSFEQIHRGMLMAKRYLDNYIG